MIGGILQFEALEAEGAFDPHSIRRWAEGFSTPVFLRNLRLFILDRVPEACDAIAPELEAEYLSGRSSAGECAICCVARCGGVCLR